MKKLFAALGVCFGLLLVSTPAQAELIYAYTWNAYDNWSGAMRPQFDVYLDTEDVNIIDVGTNFLWVGMMRDYAPYVDNWGGGLVSAPATFQWTGTQWVSTPSEGFDPDKIIDLILSYDLVEEAREKAERERIAEEEKRARFKAKYGGYVGLEQQKQSDLCGQRGRSYYDSGDYANAILECNRAIELNGRNDQAYFQRGEAYYAMKDYKNAILDFSSAIELKPFKGRYRRRGLAYYHQGEYEEAIADYSRAIELDPSYKYAYNNRGSAYEALKEYGKAVADYSRAIELDSKFEVAYYNRGLAYFYMKDYQKAIANYSRAIELDPKDANAYNNRGVAYFNLKDYDKAIADYKKALELKPDYTKAKENLQKALDAKAKMG